MVNLTQMVAVSVAALGLNAQVGLGNEEGDLGYNMGEPCRYAEVVKVAEEGYGAAFWEEGHYTAIGEGRGSEEIYLANLWFQSCEVGTPGVIVMKDLTEDELDSLDINTRDSLYSFLEDRAETFEGYAGPNFLF